MSAEQQTPVVTSLDPEQLRSVLDFMERVRQDNTIVAGLEAERLRPYLSVLAEQLARDLPTEEREKPGLRLGDALKKPGYLCALFNMVAQRTNNTILSEMMITPIHFFEQSYQQKLTGSMENRYIPGSLQFVGYPRYENLVFALGFIQVVKDRDGSVSVPVFGLDANMMKAVSSLQPETMLQAFQYLATAGNHDVLHHYSNRYLNSAISITPSDPEEKAPLRSWADHYFAKHVDQDPQSLESWLMLNHVRVRRLMEEGTEGEKLRAACDQFFDELDRIGKQLPPAMAHKAVDYFGSVLCFTLMRYMPLSHPLLQHAIAQLEGADPQASDLLSQRQQRILADISWQKEEIREALENYRAAGLPLAGDDYASLKSLQLMMIEPWVTHLISPARPGTALAEMQARVSAVNNDMFEAVFSNEDLSDGVHYSEIKSTDADGRPLVSVIERHCKNGVYQRDDGPAYISVKSTGERLERWYRAGEMYRQVETRQDGTQVEKFYKDGRPVEPPSKKEKIRQPPA